MITNKIRTIAQKAAQEAGDVLAKRYNKFNRNNVKFKAKNEIVTKADLAAEKVIINMIKKNFPEHRILSEEAGKINTNSDYLWIIDPLDGTTNFSMHNPLWSTCLALAYKNKIVLGIIYAPILNETFQAEKGKGAFLNKKRIRVSNYKDGNVINAFCSSRETKDIEQATAYYKQQKLNQLDCRSLGSASIELAYVSCGRIESITIPGANSWDVAAGALIIREAGGRVTNFKDEAWNINSLDFIGSNGKVHKQILSIIK